MTLNTHLSIITLNLNALNVPTKRHRAAKWIGKKKSRCKQGLPPCTTTSKLKLKYRKNIIQQSEIKLIGSPTTTELKKPHPSRRVGGVETQKQSGPTNKCGG